MNILRSSSSRGDEDAGNIQDADPFNNSKWDYVIDLGTKGTGPFSSAVTGLSQPSVYYFRAYAVNSGGSTWSPVAGTFNSKPLLINRIVLPLGFLSTKPATTY